MTIKTATTEIPEAMLAQFGIDRFKADGHDSSVQAVLGGADTEALLKACLIGSEVKNAAPFLLGVL